MRSTLFTTLRASAQAGIPRQTIRTMATFPGKKEFLCIIPDKPDVLEQRLKVRPLHFEHIKPVVGEGHLVTGGATVSHHTPPGETLAFKGSFAIYSVESVEEAWEIIKADPYAVNGVWDLDNIQIIPVVSAVRQPLNQIAPKK